MKRGFNENLRWASESISVPIHKILVGGDHQPLLNCIERPSLPPLLDSSQLSGDAYQLFEPIRFTLSPGPREGKGTGVSIHHIGFIFPLHGLLYEAKSKRFLMQSPWYCQKPFLPLSQWRNQDLVQMNRIRQTIHEVISDVRNQRGAHADRNWTMDFPQPLRQFYWLYANLFIVQVGCYLVDEAAKAIRNDEFRCMVFPNIRPRKALQYSMPLRDKLTIEKVRLGSGSGFSFKYDEAVAITHTPHQGPGTMSTSTDLWFMQAAGRALSIPPSTGKAR